MNPFLIISIVIWASLAGCSDTPKEASPAPPVSKPKPSQKQPITSLATATTATAVEPPAPPVYSYEPTGKKDPFAPIIQPASQKAKIGNRPPLERYNINEFKLSGIVWGGFGYNAMLEGPDGKGYFVRVGTVLGPNGGVVKKITSTTMIVEEKFKAYNGELERKETIVELRKKQEEAP